MKLKDAKTIYLKVLGWTILRTQNIDYKWLIPIFLSILAIAQPYILEVIKDNQVTQVFYYVPDDVNADISSTIPTIKCWTDSIATQREDAFRCMNENIIYDPCFDIPLNTNFVSCPDTPYGDDLHFKADKLEHESTADIFRNTDIASSTEIERFPTPWFIKLSDGTNCEMVTGASSMIAGYRMDYMCSGKETKWLLLPVEKIDGTSYVNCWKDRSLQQCAIKELWY